MDTATKTEYVVLRTIASNGVRLTDQPTAGRVVFSSTSYAEMLDHARTLCTGKGYALALRREDLVHYEP